MPVNEVSRFDPLQVLRGSAVTVANSDSTGCVVGGRERLAIVNVSRRFFYSSIFFLFSGMGNTTSHSHDYHIDDELMLNVLRCHLTY